MRGSCRLAATSLLVWLALSSRDSRGTCDRRESADMYAESALRVLKLLPRVSLQNLARNPYIPKPVSACSAGVISRKRR